MRARWPASWPETPTSWLRSRRAIPARCCGKWRGQLAAIPDWFHYFAGLADKLEGATIPVDKPNFLIYTRREPAGRRRCHRAVELPALAAVLEGWPRPPAAGCTVVAKPSDYSPASAVEAGRPDGRGRLPARRAQRGDGLRARGRDGPGRLGDPSDAATEMGPLATEPQYRKVLSFFDSATAEGRDRGGGRDVGRSGWAAISSSPLC